METGENRIGHEVQRLRAHLQNLCDPLKNLRNQMEAIEVMGVRFSPLFTITQFDPFSNVNSKQKDTSSDLARNQLTKPFKSKSQEYEQCSMRDLKLPGQNPLTSPRKQDVQSGSVLKSGDTRLGSNMETGRTKKTQLGNHQTPLFKLHTLQKQFDSKVRSVNGLSSINDKNLGNSGALTKSIRNAGKDLNTNHTVDSATLKNGQHESNDNYSSNQKQVQSQIKIATVKELLSAKSNLFEEQNVIQLTNLLQSGISENSEIQEETVLRDSKPESKLENSHWTITAAPILEAVSIPFNSTKIQQDDIKFQNIADPAKNMLPALSDLNNKNKTDPLQTQAIEMSHSGLPSGLESLLQSSTVSSQIPNTTKKESPLYSSEDITEMVNTVLRDHAKIHGVERL